jgi:VanZ family protein
MIFKFSSGTVPMASQSFWLDFFIKKAGHVIIFATLAILIYRALIGGGIDRKKAAIYSVVIAFLYGISDEFHQSFTQGRGSKFRDTIIDGMGAGVAIFIIYRFVYRLPKRLCEILLKIGIK